MLVVSKAKGLCPLEPRQGRALGTLKASKRWPPETLQNPGAAIFSKPIKWIAKASLCWGVQGGKAPLALLTNRRERRASVSVEFALVAVMILLPLFAGGVDFMELISAQSQLDASLQSLYAFAWNSPGSATNASQVNGILAVVNAHSLPQVSLGAAPSLSYQTAASGPQTFVTYNLATTVNLPVPVPYLLGSSFALAASGTVQIQ